MLETLTKFALIAAGTGAFTAAMIGETAAEILGAVAGALVGALIALTTLSRPSPLSWTPGAALDGAVIALWCSTLGWLAVLWWETLADRRPPRDVKQ